jgi:hypothetical protein
MLRKLAITLAIAVLILNLASINLRTAFSNEADGQIDLFTQKEPFSGKGPNMFSDAFSFGEDVQINAFTTYNKEPVSNILVGFEIIGPKNSFENFTSYRSALTNENGVATINFRTPYLTEAALGIWTIFGSAKICDLVVNDSVLFKVGWIVEIVSIRTINWNHISQEEFSRGSCMGVELGLKSISMTSKTASLTIAAYDLLNNPINSTELNNFIVPPNETIAYAYLFLYLSKTAHIGIATVYANAYTAPVALNGHRYCPEVSKQFSIIPHLYFLTVRTAPSGITTILGEGLYEEYTNVNLTAQTSLTIDIGTEYTFSYWDVDGIPQGMGNNSITVLMDDNHTATAHYTLVIMYTLTIITTTGGRTDPPPGTYNYPAGFSVQVTATPDAEYILSYWELNGINVGSTVSYTVTMDGNKTLRAVFSHVPAGWFIPEWFYWPLLPLLILAIILLIILFYYMRRKKKVEAAFYSGWTAWYYGYDLRNKGKTATFKKK